MLRALFTFILVGHGLIHLMGFVKEFKLSKVEGLTGKTLIPISADWSKIIGFSWLLAFLLFLLAILTFLVKKEWWWMVAAGAIILSQLLIILYWQEAKFGTIANIIVLLVITLSYGSWRFNSMVKHELETFLPQAPQQEKAVTQDMIKHLPVVVQKWLHRSNIVGTHFIHRVYLTQKGEMRTKPDGNWMPVEAQEYFTVYNPGFIWVADVKAAPYVHLYGRDKYENGRGQMLIKLFSLFPVADAKGKETDQGTLLRYLGEIVWFPSAALSEYIAWKQLDATSAKATMSYGGIRSSGIFTFTQEGDVVSFEANRYYTRKEGATLERWVVTTDKESYKEFDGIRIPAKSSVTWKLKEGDFTWFKLEITDIQYNKENSSTVLLSSN